MITLFDHQKSVISKAYRSLAIKLKNLLIVLPTGAGKTIVKAQLAKDAYLQGKTTLVFAHRDVLLTQISLAMCMLGVPHTFMVSNKTRTHITNLHLKKFGKSFYVETSPIIIVSTRAFAHRYRKGKLNWLLDRVKLWLMDEAHHALKNNETGKCVTALKNAYGIGFTATPCRADNKGLGSHADGVFDEMIIGSTMGELIKIGKLAPYKIFVPPTKIDLAGLKIQSNGDWNTDQLAERTDKKEITGDAVAQYLKLAAGKKAITFTCNIKHSEHVAKQFNDAGIPSRAISSKNTDAERQQALDDFENGIILNLVNCDLFGEGFDVPSVEVCIMLRKTESYSLFKQQFGRCLRVLAGKLYGILIDHVGNVERHCTYSPPHEDPVWSLDGGSLRIKQDVDAEKARQCPVCRLHYFPKGKDYTCEHCGHTETTAEIIEVERKWQKDNSELVELTSDFIDAILAERAHIDKPVEVIKEEVAHYTQQVIKNSIISNHIKRQHAQSILRETIQNWCAAKAICELWDVDTTRREFAVQFGINILQAQILSERKALELAEKIRNECHTENDLLEVN